MQRTKCALIELLLNFIVVASLLVSFWMVERLLRMLWPNKEKMFFDTVPISWFFDLADMGVLLVFLIYGVYSTGLTFFLGDSE